MNPGASFALLDASVQFAGIAALRSIDLEIASGERVGLVGPSGSGKTTLLRLLNASVRPTGGQVHVDDRAVAGLSGRALRRVRAEIGFIPQDLGLVPNLRVSQNVLSGRLGALSFLGSLRSVLFPSKSELEHVHRLLDRVGIPEKLFERTDRLSGGQQQRAAIARTLMQAPRAILADEPVASVDPARAHDTVALLSEVCEQSGLTLVMSLHNLSLAREFFPRLVGLRHGEVVFDEKADELAEDRFRELYHLNPEEIFSRMAPDFGKRPFPLGMRALLLLLVIAAGLLSASQLGLFDSAAGPGRAGFDVAIEFFSRAVTPALRSEAPPPFGGTSLLPSVIEAAHQTIVFAAAGLGLALVVGCVLGILGSTAWWPRGTLARTILPAIYAGTRVVIALLRSVHELIWAVLFLAALGRSDITAVVAIAIPISGTLAKLFSELIDETSRDAALVLRAAGAGPMQVFTFGFLPRALPDMAATALYQFECALRSSTVLGFFGFPTLGYAISASFQNLHYGEVWTYLYALLILIVAAEWWSGAIRRRMV